MRAPAFVLLLSACASNGAGPHLMVTDTHHGPITWSRFQTLAECEQASRESDIETRCTTARAERLRRWEQRRAAR